MTPRGFRGTAPNPAGGFIQLLDGFYVDDPPTANQIVLTAGVAATALLDLYWISGGVTGGLYATINFHLHNDSDDPHLRFSTIASELFTNPLSVFDVSGDLTARLSAFVQIYYVFSSSRWDFNIASAHPAVIQHQSQRRPGARRHELERLAHSDYVWAARDADCNRQPDLERLERSGPQGHGPVRRHDDPHPPGHRGRRNEWSGHAPHPILESGQPRDPGELYARERVSRPARRR